VGSGRCRQVAEAIRCRGSDADFQQLIDGLDDFEPCGLEASVPLEALKNAG